MSLLSVLAGVGGSAYNLLEFDTASADLSTGTSNFNAIVALSDTTGIVVYCDEGDSYKMYARHITANADSTVTVGSAVLVAGADSSGRSINNLIKLTATKAVLISPNSATAATYAYVLDVSGTTITAGSEQTLTFGGITSLVSSRVSDTSIIACYRDISPDDALAVILSVSGTTITTNTPVTITTTNGTAVYGLCELTTNVFVVSYDPGAATKMSVLTVSGTSITVGYGYDNVSTHQGAITLVALDSSTFLAYYSKPTTLYGYAKICTVASEVITQGSEIEVFAENAASLPAGGIHQSRIIIGVYATDNVRLLDVVSGAITLRDIASYSGTGGNMKFSKLDTHRILACFEVAGKTKVVVINIV